MRFTSTSPRSSRRPSRSICSISTAAICESRPDRAHEHLKRIIGDTDIQFSESFEVDGKKMYAHAARSGSKASSRKCASAYTSATG